MVDCGSDHGDLAHTFRQDSTGGTCPGQHYSRSDPAPARRSDLADRFHGRSGRRPATSTHPRPRCGRSVPGGWLSQRGPRRALSEPDRRSERRCETASPAGVLYGDLSDRFEFGSAYRSTRILDLYPSPGGDRRARRNLRVPVPSEPLHQLCDDGVQGTVQRGCPPSGGVTPRQPGTAMGLGSGGLWG